MRNGIKKRGVKRKKGFVLDSFALLSFFQAEKGAAEVMRILEQAGAGRAVACLSAINLGEIFYITWRRLGKEIAQEMLDDIKRLPVRVEEASLERILAAAEIRAEFPLSYADTFAVALGMELGTPVVTGDREFMAVESLIRIIWLDK